MPGFLQIRRWTMLAAVILLVPAVQASGQETGFSPPEPPSPDFTLGIGYASLGIGDDALASEDALRFDGAVSFAPLSSMPQFRLGGAFGTALVLDDSRRTIVTDEGVLVTGTGDIPLLFLEPELRLSWRQYLGANEVFYIEPGIGGGGLFANLSIDADDGSGDSFDEWESTLTARAFLNIGFEVTGGMAGLQVSYMRGGDIEFGEGADGEVD